MSPGSAHKVIGVGSVDVQTLALAPTQSRGPTADGRIKPDLQAPTNTETASNASDTALRVFNGTSGATPYAGGAAALARKYRVVGFDVDAARIAEIHDGHDRTGEVEEAVAAIWQELLQVERVGRNDHFFELGGHSLLATRLVARVRDRIGVELPLIRVFEAPTIRGLATFLVPGGNPDAHAGRLTPRGQPVRATTMGPASFRKI